MNYIKKANTWYQNRKSYIDKLIESEASNHSPDMKDLLHPELWKPSNWKWFLNRKSKK